MEQAYFIIGCIAVFGLGQLSMSWPEHALARGLLPHQDHLDGKAMWYRVVGMWAMMFSAGLGVAHYGWIALPIVVIGGFFASYPLSMLLPGAHIVASPLLAGGGIIALIWWALS